MQEYTKRITSCYREQALKEASVSIKVLLADDCPEMLMAIRSALSDEPRLEVVGEASTFAATIEMIASRKPDVLLLDLHLPEKDLGADFVKSQLVSVPRTVAVSVSNDSEAQVLAQSYGATVLLDKMNLYTEMVPAILGRRA
jgi:two-component system chemotaxis response regulator CheB